jgi:hypothetical protein
MIHICIHVLPQEIDQLEQLLILLKRNSLSLPDDHGIKVQVCLNYSFVNWKNSYFVKGFFNHKFSNLEKLTKSWSPECHFFISDNDLIKGCNDLRRIAIRNTNKPYVMYLDADNIFEEGFLCYMWNFLVNNTYENSYYHDDPERKESEFYKSTYCVYTPETTRMWDSTWDCITNENFLDQPASHLTYDNRDPYHAVDLLRNEERELRLINGFKFAGWGTTIDTRLARLIDIPDSLGSYGLDDTFIMLGCQILRDKGIDVRQYVIKNEIIIENNKFRDNPYDILTIDKRKEFLAQAEANFQPELQKLYERIKPLR